jgi:hypothetical protein
MIVTGLFVVHGVCRNQPLRSFNRLIHSSKHEFFIWTDITQYPTLSWNIKMLVAVWWLTIWHMLVKHFYAKSLIKCPQVWRTLCTQLHTAQYGASHHSKCRLTDAKWNVMAHAQKPNFVFRRNGRFHLNRWGRQFSRLLAAEVCALAVVMLDKPCSEVVWRVLVTHSIRQFPFHFPRRASPCAITFQLKSTKIYLRHLGRGGRQLHICKLWNVHHTGVIN